MHSPGPWRISHAKPTKTRGIDILSGYAHAVAHVPVPPAYMTDHPEHDDAKLIAAAPELLEALDWLLNCVDAYQRTASTPDDDERLRLAQGAARITIAKATPPAPNKQLNGGVDE